MSKQFLPSGLDPSYISHWTKWAGVREFLQNAKDSDTEGNPMTVKYDHAKGVLTLTNTGVTIDRSALLLGRSSKRDNSELIGKHGEGMKVGALVLTRFGCKVVIHAGAEQWIPVLEENCQAYGGAACFGFDIRQAKSQGTDRVVVTIDHITREEWLEWRELVLWLPDAPKVNRICTPHGDLLNGFAQRGKIYVKGVYVQTKAEYSFGYDFRNVDLDRDRQVIDACDLNAAIARVVSAAGSSDEGMMRRLYAVLAMGTKDMADNSVWNFPQEFHQAVAAEFVKEHGEGAVAVCGEAEAKEAVAAGLRPVQVKPALADSVARVHGTASDQRKRIAKEATKVHAEQDLTAEERDHLRQALAVVGAECPALAGYTIEVVDFRLKDTKILTSGPADQVSYIRIARGELGDGPALVAGLAERLEKVAEGLLKRLLVAALRAQSDLGAPEPLPLAA